MNTNKNNRKIKALLTIIITITLLCSVTVISFAESTDESYVSGENDVTFESFDDTGGDITPNIFDEIYSVVESNADKIFSILAFIGTLIVSIGYKSGLLPLLNDALSKLRGAIENVGERGEKYSATTYERIAEMSEGIKTVTDKLSLVESKVKDYDLLSKERDTMRTILENQIDMLYAIFISSSLPQYQKEEIGNKIQRMREELNSYDEAEK